MNRNYIREDDVPPATVEGWIKDVNRIEQVGDDENDDSRRLPSGWWILPTLLIGALLSVFVVAGQID